MTAKEYLSQAYRLNRRISTKLSEVKAVREITGMATTILSDMPRSATRNIRRIEDSIAKLMDMESELVSDIERLVSIRQEIADVINAIDNQIYSTLLFLRYLCFKDWDAIAHELKYSPKHIFKLHGLALQKVDTKRYQKILENPNEI